MDRASLVVGVFLLVATTAAHAEHPLFTDDIDTQGKGGWQLELNGERNRDRVGDDTVTGEVAEAQLSYGLTDTIDLQFGVPWLDIGAARGFGDVRFDLKWRMYESGPLKLGLKPGFTLPTGDDTTRIGAGRVNWGAVAVLAYESGWGALLGNVGYLRFNNTAGDRSDLTRISAAVLPRVTKDLRLVLDVAFDTNPDPAARGWLRRTVVGFIYGVNKDFDFDMGYRVGNEPAIDRAIMAGITIRW